MSNSLPAVGSPEVNASPKGVSRHWIVLGLLVVAQAAFGACFIPRGRTLGIAGFVLIGAILSQPILLAIWAAFAHQRFYCRILWALLLCILVSFVEELGTVIYASPANGFLMLMDTTMFFFTTFVLSIFRYFSRWQIKQPGREEAPSAYLGYNFGIKHLLALTTVTALACGLFRTAHNIAPGQTRSYSLVQFISLCLFLALLFPVVALPWITLANHRRLRSPILIAIGMVGVLDLAVCLITSDIGPPGSVRLSFDIIKPFLLIQLGAVISVVASTLVMRFCGFRMIREPRIKDVNSPSAPAP